MTPISARLYEQVCECRADTNLGLKLYLEILPLHGAVQSSREELSSPTRAPDARQLADTFHLDARVHKNQSLRPRCMHNEFPLRSIGSAEMEKIMNLNLRPESECKYDAVSLGEVMLRLDPGEGRIRTARTFRAWEGGGEYNVVRGLKKCFKMNTAVITAFADNEVGMLMEDFIMQGGVDTSLIHWMKRTALAASAATASISPSAASASGGR